MRSSLSSRMRMVRGVDMSCVDSKFEIESALLELLVFFRVETEQLRGAMTSGDLGFLQGNKQSEAQHFFAEVPLVQPGFEHRFVQMLKLRERKLRRQQFEADWLVADFSFQAGEGQHEDL